MTTQIVLVPGFWLGAWAWDDVVPLLQARGLFRREYEGTTLREHYGLPRPTSRYAAAPEGVDGSAPLAARPVEGTFAGRRLPAPTVS